LCLLLLSPSVTSVSVEVSPKGNLMRKQDDALPSLVDKANEESVFADMFAGGARCGGEDESEEDESEENERATMEEDEVEVDLFREEEILREHSKKKTKSMSLPRWSKVCAGECQAKSQDCVTFFTCQKTLRLRFELAIETKCFDEKCYKEYQAKQEAARITLTICHKNSTSNYFSKEDRGCYAAWEEEITTAKAEYTKECKKVGTQPSPKPSDCIKTDKCAASTKKYDSCAEQVKDSYASCMWESKKSDDKCAEQKKFMQDTCSLENSCRKERRDCKNQHRAFEKISCFDQKSYDKYLRELKELVVVCKANATTVKESEKCWTESITARKDAAAEYRVECSKVGSKPPPACSSECPRSSSCKHAENDVTACLENICTAGVPRH